MTRTDRSTLRLGAEAVSELFKPARLEVYESLQVAGPATIAELALRLGRPADSLYYHVKKLISIGLVESSEPPRATAGPGRKGALYALRRRQLEVVLDPTSDRSREAWSKGGAAVLRLAQRDFARALEAREVRAHGARRNLLLQRVKVRLSAAQLREVNAHLNALHELLKTYAENTKGELHAITCVMTTLDEGKPR